jgi:ABC-2 type transport system permease protein
MFANVFAKSLRDLRRSVAGWSISIVALVVVMAALWPSIRGMPDLTEFLAAYPEAMKQLFDIEAITTAAGYLNAELFSLLLPGMFIAFGVARGARLVAGDEEDGTLETLVVTPVSRTRLLLDKTAALVVAIAVLGLVLFASTWAAGAVVDMDLGPATIAVGALSMTLLGIEHGVLALAVGAATGRRALAIGVGAVVALAGYVLYVSALFVEAMEPWQPLSPFQQALGDGPLGATAVPIPFAWMPLAALVVLGIAGVVFDRRDIAAA